MEATGQAYTRDAGTGAVSLATGAQAARTIQAQQLAFQRAAQLSEQSGIQHEVKADGTVSPVIVNNQPVRTSAESRFNLDLQFRRQMGLMEQTGQAFNIDPATGQATLATGAEALSTLGRLQQNLQNAQIMSQITGQQFTVDANGNLVRGTADTEARRQFTLENMLRQALGMSEATGYVYDPITGQRTSQETVQGQIARSQVLLSLANSLGNLTPEQIAQLLGKASPTSPPGGGGTPTTSPNTNDDGRLGAGQTELLQTLTAPDSPREGWLYNIGGTLVRYKGGKYYRMDGSIFTPGSTPTTQSNTPTTQSNTPTTQQTTPTTQKTTPTTQDPTSTTPLTDSERQVVTSSLSGALFDGRYKYEPSLGGWVVYKGNNWYKYGATPPTQNITWNGQNMNVYPGYSTYYNGEIITWDGRTWIASSTTFS